MLRQRLANKAKPACHVQLRTYGGALVSSKPRRHGHPRQIQMMGAWPHWRSLPNSHKPNYKNTFVLKPVSEHVKELEERKAPTWPRIKNAGQAWQSTIGDPHGLKGWWTPEYTYEPYCVTWEPALPPMPNVKKGDLIAGAQFYRTQGWREAMSSPTEPAIQTVGRLDPDNQRPVDLVAHMPVPESTTPEGEFDYRHNRLPVWHADRRPWIYFMSAGVTACGFAFLRGLIHKTVYSWWPAKDVFAAGIIEADLRPIYVGQNFVVKWRGKPVFLKRRTPEQIALAQADDAIVGSLRDPEIDAKRCPRPEWLICLGVCTHLGCIPFPDQGNWGGYFCPCHGSHYDHSGRIRAGPAPLNLEIVQHDFIDDVTVKIG